jgi:hypothetical protein
MIKILTYIGIIISAIGLDILFVINPKVTMYIIAILLGVAVISYIALIVTEKK